VKIKGKIYFEDRRLRQYRNVDNPHDFLSYDDVDTNDVEEIHLTGLQDTGNLVNMEQEMTKHGAVLCPQCQSDDVELIKIANSTDSTGTQEQEEEYECRRCQRRFSKRV
jgi:hypothetical protein